ncbi:hypothetical protein N7541_001925 [Penicillium brevicompactum]|uniref:Uncharacterized protein n=1 Tax=Penicillium brevicompactum TaxID=5074 RepID=A0A9W9RJ56_PENBR|nr:hypothetical protein N7541_001925 [Penicillium brevicompactum]
MGLIKTGLTLAGSYGLIKAASKGTRAANSHEEKKQKRGNHPQHPQSFDQGMPYYGPNPNGPPNGYYQSHQPYQPHEMPANGYYQNHQSQPYEMPANHFTPGNQPQHNSMRHEMPANEYIPNGNSNHHRGHDSSHPYQAPKELQPPASPVSSMGTIPPRYQSGHNTPRQDSPVSSQH